MKNIFIYRILAAWIDQVLGFLVAIPFILVAMFTDLMSNIIYASFAFSIPLSVFLCKDILSSQSFGKRPFKLRIFNQRNKQPTTSSAILVLRNLFLIIWPIDLFFCVFNSKRRLGDLLTGTYVYRLEKDHTPTKSGRKQYLIFLLVFLFLWAINFAGLYLAYNHFPEIKLLYSSSL